MSGTVGAKYDLGDGHTEPSPRLFNTTDNRIGRRGKMQLKYRLCGCKCRLNNRKRETGTSVPLISMASWLSLPFDSPDSYLAPKSARLTSTEHYLLRSDTPSSKVLATLNPTLVRLPRSNALLLRVSLMIVLASPLSNTSTSLNQALQIFAHQAQNSPKKKIALCCGSTTLTFWLTYASLFAVHPN